MYYNYVQKLLIQISDDVETATDILLALSIGTNAIKVLQYLLHNNIMN